MTLEEFSTSNKLGKTTYTDSFQRITLLLICSSSIISVLSIFQRISFNTYSHETHEASATRSFYLKGDPPNPDPLPGVHPDPLLVPGANPICLLTGVVGPADSDPVPGVP
jgi:hypothetical protein